MKIDLDYMRKMLAALIESPNSSIKLWDLVEAVNGFDSESNRFTEKFIFHITLFIENGLISNINLESHSLVSIGLHINTRYHDYNQSIHIRATQAGHDLFNLLNKSEIFENLKTDFKNAPFEVMVNAGKELATAFMKKKVKEIVG